MRIESIPVGMVGGNPVAPIRMIGRFGNGLNNSRSGFPSLDLTCFSIIYEDFFLEENRLVLLGGDENRETAILYGIRHTI